MCIFKSDGRIHLLCPTPYSPQAGRELLFTPKEGIVLVMLSGSEACPNGESRRASLLPATSPCPLLAQGEGGRLRPVEVIFYGLTKLKSGNPWYPAHI